MRLSLFIQKSKIKIIEKVFLRSYSTKRCYTMPFYADVECAANEAASVMSVARAGL